ncbi:MAG: TlpA family protein disulfide reductase [Bryobacterales bacterium]|nr:TlpA family protein disulfide reductase [Bryobacterales bacterium]
MKSGRPERALQILIAVLVIAFSWVVYDSLRNRVIEAGDSAPGFSITTDSGRTLSPGNFGGKLLVLHFWATWCPPCVEEIPSLSAFQKQFASSGVVVLGVSVDKNEKAYSAFLNRFQVTFNTARDPSAMLPASYGTYQYPETYIINSSGKVVQKIIANRDWTDAGMTALVKSLL